MHPNSVIQTTDKSEDHQMTESQDRCLINRLLMQSWGWTTASNCHRSGGFLSSIIDTGRSNLIKLSCLWHLEPHLTFIKKTSPRLSSQSSQASQLRWTGWCRDGSWIFAKVLAKTITKFHKTATFSCHTYLISNHFYWVFAGFFFN